MVGSSAFGAEAGVDPLHDREGPMGWGWGPDHPGGGAELFQEDELIGAEASGLGGAGGGLGWPPGVAVDRAPLRGAIPLEMPATEVEEGVDQELLPLDPGRAKIDPLSMAEEPGPLVIEGRDPIFQAPDLEGDREGAALGAHRRTGGWGPHGSSHSPVLGHRGIFVNWFTINPYSEAR